jgi:phosphatidylinositol glycan class F
VIFFQTSTFAFLLVILSVLPIILIYGPETDNSGGLNHVLLAQQDTLKITDPLGRQLFVNFCLALLGAWTGAIPIPLDWDRPWQKWPVSCSAGAMVGASLANIVSMLLFHFELKR